MSLLLLSRRLLAAWFVLLGGCGDGPGRVGDRFVDLYFVEIDQARARPITSGLARQKLDEELRLVAEVRRGVTPDRAKPTVYYRRRGADVAGDRARSTYEVRIRHGSDESRRRVLLTLERSDGRWTVGNFTLEDEAPESPLPR